MEGLGKIILISGLVISLIGITVMFTNKIPFLGKLPGDILIRKGDSVFYFPLATSIIISIVLSVILYIFNSRN